MATVPTHPDADKSRPHPEQGEPPAEALDLSDHLARLLARWLADVAVASATATADRALDDAA